MEKLDITLTEGYHPTGGSQTCGISKDQFGSVPKTQNWYDMYAEKDFSPSKVHCWTNEQSMLKRSFPRTAGQSLSLAPAPRPISSICTENGRGQLGTSLTCATRQPTLVAV